MVASVEDMEPAEPPVEDTPVLVVAPEELPVEEEPVAVELVCYKTAPITGETDFASLERTATESDVPVEIEYIEQVVQTSHWVYIPPLESRDQAKAVLAQAQADLLAMQSAYSTIISDLNAAAAANPGDAAWQAAKAEKDQMVADFQALKTEIDALVTAINA